MARKWRVLLTCEHATAHIPRRFHCGISPQTQQSHRGWDLGALQLARLLSNVYHWPLIEGKVSRLLIDLNRSPDHTDLFSPWTRRLSEKKRQALLDAYYWPYRHQVESVIQKWTSRGERVLHLSIHSFTPIQRAQVRDTEIGLLFDPKRSTEAKHARLLQQELLQVAPTQGLWRVQMNKPYRGTDDGLTTYLRSQFPASTYAGLEIETNQKLLRTRSDQTLKRLCFALAHLA